MNIELCKYKGGAKSAFTFTFDDGCYRESSDEVIENYKRVYEETGVKIKATVGITVGFMHEWIIKFWQEAVDNGYFEIGSHSVGHDIAFLEEVPYEKRENDAKRSQEMLREMFLGEKVETYILAGGTYDENGLIPLDKYYIGVRGNKDGINYPGEINWLDVKCFTAMLKRTTKEYTDYIDEVIKTGGWGMQMNHWITHKSEDTFHSQNADTFYEECTYIGERAKAGEIWIGSFSDVAKYLRKYEKSTLVMNESDGIYTAKIEGDGAKIDTPLTILVKTDKKIALIGKDGAKTEIAPQNGKIYLEIVDFVEFKELN